MSDIAFAQATRGLEHCLRSAQLEVVASNPPSRSKPRAMDVFAREEPKDFLARVWVFRDVDDARDARRYILHDDGGIVDRMKFSVVSWGALPDEAYRSTIEGCIRHNVTLGTA